MLRRTLPLLAVVPALVVAVAHAQDGAAQRQPAFRADVSLVEVAAVVTGADGRSIADLTADDFEVVEDGVVRPLTSIRLPSADGHDRRASVPSRAGTATDTASDVERLATNAASADAPAFVLLLDDLDTSRRDSHRVIRAAETALPSIPSRRWCRY